MPTVRNPVFEIRELPGRASIRAAARDFGSGRGESEFGVVPRETLSSILDVDWKRLVVMMAGALYLVRTDVTKTKMTGITVGAMIVY